MFGKDWTKELEEIDPKPAITNGKYAPAHPFRAICAGPSSSGKTMAVISMLFGDDPNTTIMVDEIHVCTKMPDEPAYKLLKNTCQKAQDFINFQLLKSGQIGNVREGIQIAHFYTDPLDLFALLDEFDEETRRIIIFDDLELSQAGAAGKAMESFFQRSRKKNCSVVFIAQTYYGCSKFIRRNCNYKILFKPASRREIDAIVADTPFSREEFAEAAEPIWAQPHGFVMIDKKNQIRQGFYPLGAN